MLAGFLSLSLKETLGEDLPNSMQEAEDFGLNQSFWNCPVCSKYNLYPNFPLTRFSIRTLVLSKSNKVVPVRSIRRS